MLKKIYLFFTRLFGGLFKRKGQFPKELIIQEQVNVQQPVIDVREPEIEIPQALDYIAVNIDDLPDEVEKNVVYIIGENGYTWQAAFICPCGCGVLIQLNLLKDTKPSWKISYKKGNVISISPSIHRKVACRSHFNLTKGKIAWWSDEQTNY